MASHAQHASHAEQMDGIYGFQRHFYDLTRKHYLLGRDRLIDGLNPRVGDHVLEVGCGTARNLIRAAHRYPGARFYGIDISREMLKSARANLYGARLETRTRIALADATRFDPQGLFRQARFERIFFSYTLSMIPDWQAAIRMAAGVLAEGGEIHIVDFGMQQGLPRWFAGLLSGWLSKFQVTRREELFSFCEELARELGLECANHSHFRDYARSVVLRRP